MEPNLRNYTNLLNQDSSSQYSSEGTGQFSPPTSQSQFSIATSSFLHNFNPFGHLGILPPYGHSPPRFQGVQQQGSWLQAPPPSFQGFHLHESVGPLGAPTARPPSVLQFVHLGGAAANTSSHGSESSSRCSAQQEKQPFNIEELDDSSEEEEPQRRQRINWSEEENDRLFSAWTKHSTDPVIGNDRKSEYYWKAAATEFNDNGPKNSHKRSIKQLKTHWGDVKRDITKFSGCYARAMNARSNGQSDDIVKKTAHEFFKGVNKGRSFIYEYLWDVSKEMPKWRRIIQEESTTKRTKLSSSGAYTSSSNQDTEGEKSREVRPEGQKKVKARLKGIGKSAAPSPLSSQPSQNMVMYHEATPMKAKSARAEKFNTYLKLLAIDTSNFSEKEKNRHDNILNQIAKDLAEE